MNTDASGQEDGHQLTYIEASRLLKLGLTSHENPVEQLVKRLRESDGPDWLVIALQKLPEVGGAEGEHWLLDPPVSLAVIKEFKQQCIDLAGETDSEETWLIAMVGYCLAIAAALAHHKELITTRKHDEVERAIRDLERVAHHPWHGMLTTALAALSSLGEGDILRSETQVNED